MVRYRLSKIRTQDENLNRVQDSISTVLDQIQNATFARVPATATASGSPGQFAYDTSYLYICIATNTWMRVAIATF